MSLLEDAKKIKVKPNNGIILSPDIIELAVAWAKEEINSTQAYKALGKEQFSDIYPIFCRALAEYVKNERKA